MQPTTSASSTNLRVTPANIASFILENYTWSYIWIPAIDHYATYSTVSLTGGNDEEVEELPTDTAEDSELSRSIFRAVKDIGMTIEN